MTHRKQEHRAGCRPCKKFSNGDCKFGAEKCWYLHEGVDSKQITSEKCYYQSNCKNLKNINGCQYSHSQNMQENQYFRDPQQDLEPPLLRL